MSILRSTIVCCCILTSVLFAQSVADIDARANKPTQSALLRSGTPNWKQVIAKPSPLEVSVSVPDPAKIQFGTPFQFQVEIRNLGTEPVTLPTSLLSTNMEEAAKQGGSVELATLVIHMNDETGVSYPASESIELWGSPNQPGTLAVLNRGESIRVEGIGGLRPHSVGPTPNVATKARLDVTFTVESSRLLANGTSYQHDPVYWVHSPSRYEVYLQPSQ
jgi:hypothetical protein